MRVWTRWVSITLLLEACEGRPLVGSASDHVVSATVVTSEATTVGGSDTGTSSGITSTSDSSDSDPTQGSSCGDGVPDIDVYCHIPKTTETFAGRKAVGDIDNDGHADLVFLGKNNSLSYWKGTGTGAPEPSQTLTYNTSLVGTPALFIQDFDADLDKDLITTTPNALWIAFNDGSGVLGEPQDFPPPAYMFPSLSFDLNNDNRADLVAGSLEPQLQVFLNLGDNTFDLISSHTIPGCYVNTLSSLDVDGDTQTDVVAVGGCNDPPMKILAQVFRGTDGGLALLSTFEVGMNPMHIASGDVNGDGDTDIVVSNVGSGEISIYDNDGSGTFQKAATATPCPNCLRLRESWLADLDGDGQEDEVISLLDDMDKKSTLFITLDPSGAPDISLVASFSFDTLAIADFNEDNIDDIALSQISPLGELLFLFSNP